MRPNQYIWRRRIQQYGPRLEKPYAFYDWVQTARDEIKRRGEEPIPLALEPGGAEIAGPHKAFQPASAGMQEPDPRGLIQRDGKGLIRIESAVAPGHVAPGKVVRFHLAPGPRDAVSTEVRELEGELRIPAGAKPGKLEVPAYVLYYVCEGESGTCKFLRQDFEFEVVVR